jgi:Photosynthesis system II assembly factor YCF48
MKDDSARDKAIEKLAAQKLRAGAATPSGACPDAEILAAYFERTLAAKERATWEAHFSSCVRCQAQLAALARMSSGEEESPAAAPMTAPVPSRKIFGLRWAWAAPMLVAMFVAGLWYTGELEPLLRQNIETPKQIPSPAPPTTAPRAASANPAMKPAPLHAEKTERAAPTPPPAEDRLRPSGRAAERRMSNERSSVPTQKEAAAAAPSTAAETNRLAMTPPPPKAVPKGALAQGNIAPPAERMQMAARPSQREESAASAGVAGGVAAAPAARPEQETKGAAVSAQNVPLASQRSDSAKAIGTFTARQSVVVSEAPAQEQGTMRKLATAGFHYGRASAGTAAEGFVSSTRLWRVGPHGLIQVRNEENAWVAKPSGVVVDLLGVSFPSAGVGWVVGQVGTVLRSIDGGGTWSKVTSPTNKDLVHVTAFSTQSATVNARNGRTFSTSDGGRTWAQVSGPK